MRLLLVCLLLLFVCSCSFKEYPPSQFVGTVVEGRCTPSELGSGDTYTVFLNVGKPQPVSLVYYWPPATEMCYQLTKQPKLNSKWTVRITNRYTPPNESSYTMSLFEVVKIEQP